MAIEHIVAGPVTVRFASVDLGFSRDGGTIRIEPRWGDVNSDDWGGAGGAPADRQLLGATATVTVDLTKYEASEVEKLTAFVNAGATGTLPPLGTLIRQDARFAELALNGTKKTYTFATAFPAEPQEVNAGTRFSTFVLGFECWLNNTEARVYMSIT